MTDQNMFDGSVITTNKDQQQNSGDPTPSSQENPFADKLSGILNEKGEPKYKTVEDALEALQHSQQFIETLKSEKQDLESKYTETQAELEKRESVEEAVARLTGKSQAEPKKEDQPESKTGVDEETISSLIEQHLNGARQKETEEKNFRQVQSALVDKFGDKTREVINTRAKELNTTPAELEKMARTNPNMALSLLGGGSVVSDAPSTPSQSSRDNRGVKQDLDRPKKSLLRGGSTDDVLSYWREVRDHTYKKHGIDN